jgi:hypothetical protein
MDVYNGKFYKKKLSRYFIYSLGQTILMIALHEEIHVFLHTPRVYLAKCLSEWKIFRVKFGGKKQILYIQYIFSLSLRDMTIKQWGHYAQISELTNWIINRAFQTYHLSMWQTKEHFICIYTVLKSDDFFDCSPLL